MRIGSKKPIFVGGLVACALLLAFQNCGGNFTATSDSGTNNAAGGGTTVNPTSTATVDYLIYSAAGSVIGVDKLEQFTAYTVAFNGTSVSGTSYSYDLQDNTGGCVLGSGSVALNRTLTCATLGSATLRLIAVARDGSIAMKSGPIAINANTTGNTGDPLRVDFRIPAGTAAGAWNSAANYVLVFVGQTLRIYNDDSGAHRLHTGGSPFAHMANDIPQGGSTDVPITMEHLNPSAGDVYDHDRSSSAAFFIKSINGATLYATNCQSCHGAIASSTKRTASAADIRSAITSVNAMRNITLTDEQTRAIAFSLR